MANQAKTELGPVPVLRERRRQYVAIARAAHRGRWVRVVRGGPPWSVLVLNCEDESHAKAIERYIRVFTPDVTLRLLGESNG